MATNPHYQPITADQFLAMDFGSDRKFELSDGVIQMMTGGTETHAWVTNNITALLRSALRGSGCRSYGSEMGIRLTDTDVRYPDASIHCGARPEHGANVKALDHPLAVFEVLSPTTATYDQTVKLDEYRSIASMELIFLIDPIKERVTRHCRTPDGWSVSGPSSDYVVLPSLDLTIPHTEIFARD